jgi:tetratricopeptide (TPR) repeat protein
MKRVYLRYLFLFLITFFSYSNSLTLNYALDDRLVIFENDYTLKGFQGVKDIFTKDSFSGYFGHTKNLVSGGRYRPFSQLTFVAEYELFGGDLKHQVGYNKDPKNEKLFMDAHLPFISHLVNIILFFILLVFVYKVLEVVFEKVDHQKWFLSIPFLATLLFALHPIHTEAVTNIKGRDEILSMLGAVLSVWFSIQYIKSHKITPLLFSFISFTIAIFSKENAITFIAVLPLLFYVGSLTNHKKDYIITLIPLILGTLLFLYFRYQALGAFMASETDPNILNNPFVNATFIEKIATILITWGIYLKLMIFPHPLTHDYYPKQIAITDFSNPLVWLILAVVLFLLYWGLKNITKKNILAFSILFFVITFSITSNLFFSVGTLMNERFVFVPLLGFTIAFAYLIKLLGESKMAKVKHWIPLIVLIPFLSFYSIKTFARNFDWKDDITLFTNDVKISTESIKCNISAAGSYLKLFKESHKSKDLRLAKKHLDQALRLDPTAYNANLLMGEYYFMAEDYQASYNIYNQLAQNNPQDEIAKQNVQIVLTKMGSDQLDKIADMIVKQDITSAFKEINSILAQNPNNPDALSLKGKIFGQGLNQMDSARFYFHKALKINPNHVSALENMGVSYAIQGKLDQALEYLLKAQKLNPSSESINKNIEMVQKNKNKK